MLNILVVNSIVISYHEKNVRAHSWLMLIHLWFTCVLNHLGNKLVSSTNKWKSKKLEQWWRSLNVTRKISVWGLTPEEHRMKYQQRYKLHHLLLVTVCRRFARLWAKPLICNATYATELIQFFLTMSHDLWCQMPYCPKIYHKKNPSRQLPFEFYQQY